MMNDNKKEPCGELAIRTIAMPAHTNVNGDIFGGWVVSQMDLAGASVAYQRAKSRVVTVAIDSMTFLSPVQVGDHVCCYARVTKVGRTSMAIDVETWVVRRADGACHQVTEGVFTFVALDASGKPHPVDR